MSILSAIGSGLSAIGSALGITQAIGNLAGTALDAGTARWLAQYQADRTQQLSREAMQMQYNYDTQLMDRQNWYTQYMSNTAHQREIADLRAAGLNPILTATGGNGASTPAAGSGGMVDASAYANSYNSAIAQAVDFKRLHNETSLKNSQTDLNKSQQELNKKNTFKAGKEASLLGEQARNEAERYNNVVAERYALLKDLDNKTLLNSAMVTRTLAEAKQALSYARYNDRRSPGYGTSTSLRGPFGIGFGIDYQGDRDDVYRLIRGLSGRY